MSSSTTTRTTTTAQNKKKARVQPAHKSQSIDDDDEAIAVPASYQHQRVVSLGATLGRHIKSKHHHHHSSSKKRKNMDHCESSHSNNDDHEPSSHELTQIRRDGVPGYGPVRTAPPTSPSKTGNDDMTKKPITIDDAVESLGMGGFQYRVLFAAGLCFAADSMEVLLLSFLSVVLKAVWNLSDEQTATITSSVFVGALLGTLVLGYLGDHLGRKPVFTMTAGIICISGFLTAVANNFWTLLLFRFMVGFGVGGLTVPFDTLAEFVPNSHRGSNLLLIEYFWTAGTLCTFVCLLTPTIMCYHSSGSLMCSLTLSPFSFSGSCLGLFQFW